MSLPKSIHEAAVIGQLNTDRVRAGLRASLKRREKHPGIPLVAIFFGSFLIKIHYGLEFSRKSPVSII